MCRDADTWFLKQVRAPKHLPTDFGNRSIELGLGVELTNRTRVRVVAVVVGCEKTVDGRLAASRRCAAIVPMMIAPRELVQCLAQQDRARIEHKQG